MKARYKAYLRLNLVSIFFIIVSFSSVTLAWFAYSGLSHVKTDVDIKAWYIEMKQGEEKIVHNTKISLKNVYPGMATISETVNIKNLGDSDANVRYAIVSARVLDNENDNYVVDDIITSGYVEDILSHNYPFHINMNLSKNYVLSKGLDTTFEVSVSWPLDSGDNESDSLWGMNAYNFLDEEAKKVKADNTYEPRSAIEIVISIVAEQYVNGDDSSDPRYDLGEEILFDVVSNESCDTLSSTCLKTNVIDVNNKLGDETVTLLPSIDNVYTSGIYSNYDSMLTAITNDWTVSKRSFNVDDVLNVISKDIINANIIRSGISNRVIGNLRYGTRLTDEVNELIASNGYYQFLNDKFPYLASLNCLWIKSNYDADKAFSLNYENITMTKVYGEAKTTSCKVVPIIVANKNNL